MKVYQCINKVQKSLSIIGISKDQQNNSQNYSFRGIDDIYNNLASILAEHGLCILPEAVERTVVEKASRSGGILFYVTVRVKFSFVCAEDDSVHVVTTFGEAMDSGDKATNKAMSAAYKYACIQAFCIPTKGDNDADASSPEPVQEPGPMLLGRAHLLTLQALIKDQGIDGFEIDKWLTRAKVAKLEELTVEQGLAIISMLNKRGQLG